MVADFLTKVVDSSLMRTVLQLGRFRIYDENLTLKQNAKIGMGLPGPIAIWVVNRIFKIGRVWFACMSAPVGHSIASEGTMHSLRSYLRTWMPLFGPRPTIRTLGKRGKGICGVSHWDLLGENILFWNIVVWYLPGFLVVDNHHHLIWISGLLLW